jgi:hypothetical protein
MGLCEKPICMAEEDLDRRVMLQKLRKRAAPRWCIVSPLVVSVLLMLIICDWTVDAPMALAHGEHAQEPSLRLSTIQWYDTTWSSQSIGVNQELTVAGRFHVMSSWPLEIPSPERLTFLNVGVPGPVFVRTASEVNGVNGVSSMALEIGKITPTGLCCAAECPDAITFIRCSTYSTPVHCSVRASGSR